MIDGFNFFTKLNSNAVNTSGRQNILTIKFYMICMFFSYFHFSDTYLCNKIERNKCTLSLMATDWILWLEDNNNLCTLAKNERFCGR